MNVEMSENPVEEQASEAHLDLGPDQSNVDTESNTDTNENQVLTGYQLLITYEMKNWGNAVFCFSINASEWSRVSVLTMKMKNPLRILRGMTCLLIALMS